MGISGGKVTKTKRSQADNVGKLKYLLAKDKKLGYCISPRVMSLSGLIV
jgi:hypothetical protein